MLLSSYNSTYKVYSAIYNMLKSYIVEAVPCSGYSCCIIYSVRYQYQLTSSPFGWSRLTSHDRATMVPITCQPRINCRCSATGLARTVYSLSWMPGCFAWRTSWDCHTSEVVHASPGNVGSAVCGVVFYSTDWWRKAQCVALRCTALHSTTLRCAVLCCAALCCAVLWSLA